VVRSRVLHASDWRRGTGPVEAAEHPLLLRMRPHGEPKQLARDNERTKPDLRWNLLGRVGNRTSDKLLTILPQVHERRS
jgi:hypothetical protein